MFQCQVVTYDTEQALDLLHRTQCSGADDMRRSGYEGVPAAAPPFEQSGSLEREMRVHFSAGNGTGQ